MSAAAAAADVPAKKPGRMKKLILMAAVAALVLGGVGVGLMVYLGKQRAAAEAAADEDDARAATASPKKKEHRSPPVFVPMDNFVVNLADHDADRYAQIGVTLEVTDEKQAEEIKSYMPAIRNNILLLLAHKASADLAGSDGKVQLAREIRREALRAMGEDLPDDEDPAASAPKAKKKKVKAEDAAELPIRSVQFSSFIIQ
jgi:flagellar FliL protein